MNVKFQDRIALSVKIVLFFKKVFVKISATRILFFREENVKENVKQDLFLKIPLVKQNVIQVILLTMIKCANPAILRIVPNAILMVLLVSNVKIIHFFNRLFV